MIPNMTGKVAAVFGAGPGIGGASAQLLAAAGATVACVDVREDAAAKAAETLRASGAQAAAVQADVLDSASVRSALDGIGREHGRLDAVVDVVGASRVQRSENISQTDWQEVIDFNLRQQLIVAQQTVATMTSLSAAGGAYVAIGSICGHGAAPYQAVYGIAKAGVASMIRSLASEYAAAGIRFNAVSPGGVILTPRLQALGAGEGDLHEQFCEAIPMGRVGQPEEIAGVVLFLASDLSSYVTGQVILADGGQSVTWTLPMQAPPS